MDIYTQDLEEQLNSKELKHEKEKLKLLRVGFELEYQYGVGNRHVPEVYHNLALKGFAMEKERKKKVLQKVNAGELGNLEITKEVDQFKEHDLVGYIYHDGSVELEMVLTPQPIIHDLLVTKLKEANKIIRETSGNMLCSLPSLKCGQHQTFCYEHLLYSFHPLVVINTIQITRLFMPLKLWLFSCGNKNAATRDLHFRSINPAGHHKITTEKYTWLNAKDDKMIEFRYPDGNMSNILPSVIAHFNKAIIEKAIKYSEFGIMFIKSAYFNKVKTTTINFTENIITPEIQALIDKQYEFAMKFFDDELPIQIKKIIQTLYEKPIWKRRFSQQKWESWERLDSILAESSKIEETDIQKEIRRYIVTQSPTKEELKQMLLQKFSKRQINKYFKE